MAADRLPGGYLFELYRSYIGEPDSQRDVYVGFGLFLSGIGLAVVALVLFLWSNTLETATLTTDSTYYTWVKHAFVLGMLALPSVMLGIVVLLPADRRIRTVSIVGVGITVVAATWFYAVYPDHWYYRGDDYTVGIVATYATGMAGVTASTGAALIAHYLELVRQVEVDEIDVDEETRNHYSDDEIRGDIDAAMEDVELSWGGVEKTEYNRLQFTDHEFEGMRIDGEMKTTRSSGVDAQVEGLKGLKGSGVRTTRVHTTVDDQTRKLNELREQRRMDQLATATDRDGSRMTIWIESVLDGTRTKLYSALGRVKRN